MSFVERFIILCPYLGESTIRGSTVCNSCILPWCATAHQGRIQLLCVMVKQNTAKCDN